MPRAQPNRDGTHYEKSLHTESLSESVLSAETQDNNAFFSRVDYFRAKEEWVRRRVFNRPGWPD